jgi:hypothetical protein
MRAVGTDEAERRQYLFQNRTAAAELPPCENASNVHSPACSADQCSSGIYQQELQADSAKVTQGQEDPIQGWHYPTTIQKLPAPTVSFQQNGKAATILSVIVPADALATVGYQVRAAGSTVMVDLTVGTARSTIAVQADGTLSQVK